jgi:hypothetical protein
MVLKSRASETAVDIFFCFTVDNFAAFFPSLLLFDFFALFGGFLFVADRFPAFVADGSSKSLSPDISVRLQNSIRPTAKSAVFKKDFSHSTSPKKKKKK